MYRTALVKDVLESHEYREAFTFLGHLSAENLKAKLAAVIECLSGKLFFWFYCWSVCVQSILLHFRLLE